MKNVLLSIKPPFTDLIFSGNKNIEFRKTHPQQLPPFKIYIYESQRTKKVIGECTCHGWWLIKDYNRDISDRIVKNGCLSRDEIKQYGNGAAVYGWQLSNVKKYDKPVDLNRFYSYDEELAEFTPMLKRPLKRPPQSWCYVEEFNYDF